MKYKLEGWLSSRELAGNIRGVQQAVRSGSPQLKGDRSIINPYRPPWPDGWNQLSKSTYRKGASNGGSFKVSKTK